MKYHLTILVLTLAAALTEALGANLSMGYTEAGFLKGMKGGEWEMGLQYDQRGLEIERVLSGGVVSRKSYDDAGRLNLHGVTSGGRETRKLRYSWGVNDRLIGITNDLTKKEAWFDYDTMGNLVGATYDNIEKLFRVPDAVGNLYKSADRKDRKYGAGGRLLEAEGTRYDYDAEGNLTEKITADGKRWSYEWNANGSLRTVTRPDLRSVYFEYDALGRRTSKFFDRCVTRWVWDGNTPLHEWSYPFDDRPKLVKDEYGFDVKDREEPTDNVITWVFEEGTFKPTAKLSATGNQSIITDHLGTPAQMYDGHGSLTWEADFDIYGKVRNFAGSSSLSDCPFRYQGQYEDAETGLYYNRFRYYDPVSGGYLSQDPIGLAGNNPTLYGYVKDVNSWVDILGLKCSKKLATNMEANGIKRPSNTAAHHIVGSGKRAQPANDILKTHGIGIDSHQNGVFLPNSSSSGAPGHMHTGRHTNDYIDRVNRDIVEADAIGGKPAVEKQLESIRQQLLNKTYTPLQI